MKENIPIPAFDDVASGDLPDEWNKTEKNEDIEVAGLAEFDEEYFRSISAGSKYDWIAFGMENCKNQRYYTVVGENNAKLGIVGIYDTEEAQNITHIIVDPKFRGRGLLPKFYDELIRKEKVPNLIATIDVENKASEKSHKKAGFKRVSDEAFEKEFSKFKYRFVPEVYFDRGLEGYFEKGELEKEVQEMEEEIDNYLGENDNDAKYHFGVFSSKKEYVKYLKANFPERSEEDLGENDMYCIYDNATDEYFIGKFMDPDIYEDDQKVQKYLENINENLDNDKKITFDELRDQVREDKQKYKKNIYPTIAHELTHSHSFFKGVGYREPGNKWAQEMVSVFIDQKKWEKYSPGYGEARRANAREQVRDKDEDYLYTEVVKDFKDGHFEVEDWERFVYQFLESRHGKEKLKEFWIVLCERKREADLEQCFEEVFGEELKDVMRSFQKGLMKDED